MNHQYAGNKKWNVFDKGELVAVVQTRQAGMHVQHAALFPAAPDLLDACKSALKALNNPDFDCYHDAEALEAKLESAIEKATGKGAE